MKKRSENKNQEMSFFDHLEELRSSLIRALIGLFIGMIVMYIFAPTFQKWLIAPFISKEGAKLSLLTPTEGFVVRLKLSLVSGIFVTAPWIFYQLWRFVKPGLFLHERKMVMPVVFFSSLNFLLGAGFAYLILPWTTQFFLSFATPPVENLWSLGKYLDFILNMFLAFGLVFELPILIYFLARFGIVTPQFLRKYRRHAIILVLIVAAVITPPDVFTQIIIALPMIALYEVSIALAAVARRKWLQGQNEEEERQTYPTDDSPLTLTDPSRSRKDA